MGSFPWDPDNEKHMGVPSWLGPFSQSVNHPRILWSSKTLYPDWHHVKCFSDMYTHMHMCISKPPHTDTHPKSPLIIYDHNDMTLYMSSWIFSS